MAKKEKKEEQKNCPACKKALMKQKRYYRDNSYYCNLNCFNKKKEADAKAAA